MSDTEFRRYPLEKLTVGMYVTALDQPLSSTPFPINGFYIRSLEDILAIAKYGNFAVVNIRKSSLIDEFNSMMQLEVIDIPRVITQGRAATSRYRASRSLQKPQHKGRVKRLLILMGVALLMLNYL